MLTALAVLIRIVANPLSNVFQKQLAQGSAEPLVTIVATHGLLTVLALGHTADDCAESLFRNVLFNGRIGSLPPVAESRRGGFRVIRPLVFVSETLTERYARMAGLPAVGCVCGDRDSVRRDIRAFLASLDERHAGVRDSISAALI